MIAVAKVRKRSITMKTSFKILPQVDIVLRWLLVCRHWALHNKLITAQHNKLMDYGNNRSVDRIKMSHSRFVCKAIHSIEASSVWTIDIDFFVAIVCTIIRWCDDGTNMMIIRQVNLVWLFGRSPFYFCNAAKLVHYGNKIRYWN